jgi:hypothetical protein
MQQATARMASRNGHQAIAAQRVVEVSSSAYWILIQVAGDQIADYFIN